MHKGKKHKSVIEGYNDFARSEGVEAKKYVDSIRKNDPFAKGVDDMMDEESRRRESGYYVEGTVIKSPKKEKTPLNHCESDMMHQGGWAKMRTINSPGTTGNKEGIAHNEKMRGFKLPHQSPLNKKGEKDACYHKVKSRVKVWPSAYASGQLVQCRKAGAANWGEKSKKK